jgi:hypothetical protein
LLLITCQKNIVGWQQYGKRRRRQDKAAANIYSIPEEIKFTLNHWRDAVQVQGYARFQVLS